MDAQRALLVQNLELSWRYSIGNAYEEASFPESLDQAQVMAELGFEAVGDAIVRVSITRRRDALSGLDDGGEAARGGGLRPARGRPSLPRRA